MFTISLSLFPSPFHAHLSLGPLSPVLPLSHISSPSLLPFCSYSFLIYSHLFSHSLLISVPIPSCYSYSHSFLTYLFPFFPIPLPFPFQDGIEPMWEDERNKMGGRWLLNIEKRKGDDRKEILNNCWMETVRAQKCAISLYYC